MSLRKSPDPKSPLFGEWFEWEAGTVFNAPPHLNVERAIERGIAEPVKSGDLSDGSPAGQTHRKPVGRVRKRGVTDG
jgi:hypothetical protein